MGYDNYFYRYGLCGVERRGVMKFKGEKVNDWEVELFIRKMSRYKITNRFSRHLLSYRSYYVKRVGSGLPSWPFGN